MVVAHEFSPKLGGVKGRQISEASLVYTDSSRTARAMQDSYRFLPPSHRPPPPNESTHRRESSSAACTVRCLETHLWHVSPGLWAALLSLVLLCC